MKVKSATVLWACGVLSLGCRGLLGLEDEKFDVTCSPQEMIATLDDEFDFLTCDSPDTALEQRGWHFTQQEPQKDLDVEIQDGQLLVTVPDTFYWSAGKQGFLMYKEIAGDFLVVTRVKVTLPMSSSPPQDAQAGAGILVRDPFDLDMPESGNRWVAVDRGFNKGNPFIHGTWSDASSATTPNIQASTVTAGGVAICRMGNQFSFWFDQQMGWVSPMPPLDVGQIEAFSGTVQVGLIAYDYNDPGMGDGLGVEGTFELVHQHLPEGDCDPGHHGEDHIPQ